MRWSTLVLAISLSSFSPLFSQSGGPANVLSIAPPQRLIAKTGTSVSAPVKVQLSSGYHVNSNTPSDSYLIPLRLTWNPGLLEAESVIYPKPQMEKFRFSETPLSIFSGEFELVSRFKVPAASAPGLNVITGKLRYQACNDRMCLAPKTVDVTVPVNIVK